MGNRTNAALRTLLTSHNLGDVMRAVSSLEMFTLIAPYVCERMAAEGAVPVLFTLMKRSNRSVPHLKVVGHGLRALLNIAAHTDFRYALYAQPDLVPTLTELLQANYSKSASHGLLWDATALLAHITLNAPDGWAETVVRAHAECLKRLESVHAMLLRQQPAAGAKAGAGSTAAKKGLPTPLRLQQTRPNGTAADNRTSIAASVPTRKATAAPLDSGTKSLHALKRVMCALGR